MKLTSLINVTRAAAGGSNCSSLRAAYKPPNPPPRIRTLQAMPRACSAGDRGKRGPRREPPSLPHHAVPSTGRIAPARYGGLVAAGARSEEAPEGLAYREEFISAEEEQQ